VEKYVCPISHKQSVNVREIFSVKMIKYIPGSKRAYKNYDENILRNILQVVLRVCFAFFGHVVGVEFSMAYQKRDAFGVTLSANERTVSG
jgi:hypothetical protein